MTQRNLPASGSRHGSRTCWRAECLPSWRVSAARDQQASCSNRSIHLASGRRLPSSRTGDAVRHLIHIPLGAEDLRQLLGSQAPAAEGLATVDHLYAASRGEHTLDRIQEVLLHTFLEARSIKNAMDPKVRKVAHAAPHWPKAGTISR